MTIHVLVEGPSERAFLEPWSKRFLKGALLKVHPHQGKGKLPSDLEATPNPKQRGLLDQLPAKLRAFASSANQLVVLVLVDADADDCVALKESIVEAVKTCAPKLRVVVRIAVEETEAFYLGDLAGLRLGFPGFDAKQAARYVPDSICDTWEFFGRVVGDGGENKVGWAETMGPVLTTTPSKSRSPSFRALCVGLRRLAAPPKRQPNARKKWHHTSKAR